MNHPIARTALAVAALAAGLAGCGDSADEKTTSTTPPPTQTPSTATATQTQTASTPAAPASPAGQREAVVPGKRATLKSGGVGLDIKVTKVADPVVAYVDRAAEGNKLVGVFVEGQANSTIEATRTSGSATLETSTGTVSGLRVIADGDCGGGFSVNDLLLATKPAKGCIGFEIPKSATPEAITVTLTTPNGAQQATWKLPKTS